MINLHEYNEDDTYSPKWKGNRRMYDEVYAAIQRKGSIAIGSDICSFLHFFGCNDVEGGLRLMLKAKYGPGDLIFNHGGGYRTVLYEYRTEDLQMTDKAISADDRATNISSALAAGSKLPLDDLSWYLEYCGTKYLLRDPILQEVLWRNKSKQTIYKFVGLTLRVTDATMQDRGSPVYLYVSYAPVENPDVVFSREANEFLTKFEPVQETKTFTLVEGPKTRLPGAVV